MKNAKKSLKVIIDSNVWISFLIGKQLATLTDLLSSNRIIIILPSLQFDELVEVLQRPKFNKYFNQKQIEEFFSLLEEKAEWIDVVEEINLCRDPKDNYLLSAAVQSKADFLVSGDEDLLILEQLYQTQIISFKHFEGHFKV